MNYLKSIWILCVGFAIGFICAEMTRPGCDMKMVQVKPATVRTLVKVNQLLEKPFQIRIDSLKKMNQQLQVQLQTTSVQLQKSKERSRELRHSLLELLDKTGLPDKDSCRLTQGDSLRTVTLEYVRTTEQKDSLWQRLEEQWKSQLRNKDSALLIQEQQLQVIRSALLQSQLQQHQTEQQLKKSEKRLRRQQLAGRLQTTGLLIGAVFLLQQLIR